MTVTSSKAREGEAVRALSERIDAALPHLVQQKEPVGLYEPARYVLQSGGKRLRPLLLLLAARTFGVSTEQALPSALAVEVFHNFTLVHDDIMDHADERRGRATVHVKWDESTAILCGDYLMGLSYALVAGSPVGRPAELVRRLNEMTARLCEGQTLDKEFETREEVSVDEYLHMVDCKTGALLCASLEMGGMLAEVGDDEIGTLRLIGVNAGRAFQIMDDLLDLTADDERWGKAVGGDLMQGKKTYLLLRAIERTDGDERAWLERIVRDGGLPPSQVDAGRERMRRSGVLEEARHEVFRYSSAALDATHRLPNTESADTLRWLLRRMQERLH